MKYKVADKARIIPDLIAYDKRFPRLGVSKEMEKLQGKIVTITATSEPKIYWIAEDKGKYQWSEDMFSGIAEFQLCNLESRMVVETRSGNRYLVIKDDEDFYFMDTAGNTRLKIARASGTTFDDHMKHYDPNFDIMKVFEKVGTINRAKTTEELLWEREEPKKMTLKEIEQKLGYDIEIIPEESR